MNVERSLESDAMAVNVDGCKKSMCGIDATVFSGNGNSWDADEVQSSLQGDEGRSC